MAIKDVAAPNDLRSAVHALIHDKGLGRAAKILGVNRATLRRIESGSPVQAGSIALTRANHEAHTRRLAILRRPVESTT